MSIGVFGGSFDPPHVGHLIVAENARTSLGLDRVIWVPNHTPPHKGRPSAGADCRYKMVQLAVQGNDGFSVSTVELARGGASYMVDTLSTLAGRFEQDLVLILGADSLASFHTWREPGRIGELASVAAYPRGEVGPEVIDPNVLPDATWIDAPIIGISSSMIRERIAHRLTVRYLVPDTVRAYIDGNGLYNSDSC